MSPSPSLLSPPLPPPLTTSGLLCEFPLPSNRLPSPSAPLQANKAFQRLAPSQPLAYYPPSLQPPPLSSTPAYPTELLLGGERGGGVISRHAPSSGSGRRRVKGSPAKSLPRPSRPGEPTPEPASPRAPRSPLLSASTPLVGQLLMRDRGRAGPGLRRRQLRAFPAHRSHSRVSPQPRPRHGEAAVSLRPWGKAPSGGGPARPHAPSLLPSPRRKPSHVIYFFKEKKEKRGGKAAELISTLEKFWKQDILFDHLDRDRAFPSLSRRG
uniref:Vegetative cell wall protein gp1-like n=1 Tax=Phascolarctos cinereus TaxID=38626 RepID=A0A6P5K6J4_PHACI|nr:vegetative cell wall protein gp1-like [Phascolarctos cinereus]